MSLTVPQFVPFETGFTVSEESGRSILRYKTARPTLSHNMSFLAVLASVFGGWLPSILLVASFGGRPSAEGFVVIAAIWAGLIAASIVWLVKAANTSDRGRFSKKHILLERDFIVDGDGKRYAKAGITAVWVGEADGNFMHRGGADYAIGKAQAEARKEKCNSVYIQYGDRPVRIVKPILRISVADELAQVIENWRTA